MHGAVSIFIYIFDPCWILKHLSDMFGYKVCQEHLQENNPQAFGLRIHPNAFLLMALFSTSCICSSE